MSARSSVWPKRQDWTTPASPPPSPPPPARGFNRRAALMGSVTAMLAAPVIEGAVAASNPDAGLLRLIGEFNALEHEANSHYGQDLTNEQEQERDELIIEPIREKQEPLEEAIIALPAVSVAGLLARIEMLAIWNPNYGLDDGGSEGMIAAIIRDAAALKAGGLV